MSRLRTPFIGVIPSIRPLVGITPFISRGPACRLISLIQLIPKGSIYV